MNQTNQFVAASCVGIALLVAWSPADAQEVRRYGDEGGSSQSGSGGGGQQGNRMVYPGQPMPESNQGSNQTTRRRVQQQQKGSEEKKKQEGPTASYAIRVHEPGDLPQAQKKQTTQPLNKPREKMYQGVIPGKRDSVEHLKSDQESGASPSNPNKLTWVGFQPEDARTRVFLQTAREPQYSTRRETTDKGAVFVVQLRNTEVSAGNFRRFIDARHFDRVVQRIEASEQDRGVEIRLMLGKAVAPSVDASGNYVYIDFPYESADDDASNQGEE